MHQRNFLPTIFKQSMRHIGSNVQLEVFIINSGGRFTKRFIDIKTLKAETPGLHARDVIALGVCLDPKETKKKKLPIPGRKILNNVIKVRGNILLASLGNIRMILKPTELILFDPHLANVKSWVSHLSRQLQTCKDQFGLFVLEDLLRDTCDSFDRRLALYYALFRSIGDEARFKKDKDEGDNILHYSLLSNILREESNAMHRRSESPASKLSPLQDLLYEFQLELNDVKACVVDILSNPESLSRVNVTANTLANAERMDDDDSAELIFETYGLKLSASISGLLQLQQQIKTELTLADLNLKMKRNRILWLNVNLSAASLAIAFYAGCTALFGVNLVSGLETTEYLFYVLGGVSVSLSAWIYLRLLRYMRGDFSRTVEANQMAERKFLESVFSDIDAVDVVLSSSVREINSTHKQSDLFTKEEFTRLFADAKGTSEISQAEVDTVFGLLDMNKDGKVYVSELDMLFDSVDGNPEEKKNEDHSMSPGNSMAGEAKGDISKNEGSNT